MSNLKSVVVLSGGLDSAVSLHLATAQTQVSQVLTFDYGQKAAAKEMQAAKLLAQHYGLPHKMIKLDWLREITSSALVDSRTAIPKLGPDELDDPDGKNLDSAKAVWVPNRNGVFINIAAAFAESAGAGQVVVGFNREEAQTFPDNTPEFVRAANGALSFSTQNLVEVKSYVSELNKTEIVRLALEQKIPLQYVWSCYEAGAKMCWQCESCQRLKRALKDNMHYEQFLKENVFA
jgi:7-cyano-7-deazaguanine synthase